MINGWEIKADEAAKVERVDANTLKLHQGELRVVASGGRGDNGGNGDDGPQLKIITPNSEFVSRGSACLIGAHNAAAAVQPLRQLTRVLVLSGTATLTNNLGSVSGKAEDLLKVAGEGAPVAMTVGYNTEFAIDLYREIAAEGEGNVFISPYSISGALAMLLEGARGQTAEELGTVLHLPDEARRTGDETQLVPWETSRLYTGISRLNEILGDSEGEASPDRTKLKRLGKELAEIRVAARNARNAPEAKRFSDEVRVLDKKSRPLWKERKKHERGSIEYVRLTKEIEVIGEKRQALRDKARKIIDGKLAPLGRKEARVVKNLNATLKKLGGYQVNIANAIWADQSLPIEQHYADVVSSAFATGGVQSCDFLNNPERASEQINHWIVENTSGRIPGFLTPREINSETRLVLSNAIYFLGEWKLPFKESRTKKEPFVLLDESTIQVPMMSRSFEWMRYAAIDSDGSIFVAPQKYDEDNPPRLYPDEGGLHLVSLPYRDDKASMILIAPMKEDGLPELERDLTSEALTSWMDALKPRTVRVAMPKFRIEERYDLVKVLKRMGMSRAFQIPESNGGGADLTGIANDPEQPLYVSDVLHKTFVEVDEKGTEAAAVTVVVAKTSDSEASMISFTPKFRADRPFLFIIRHDETGAILFMGRVTNPGQA